MATLGQIIQLIKKRKKALEEVEEGSKAPVKAPMTKTPTPKAQDTLQFHDMDNKALLRDLDELARKVRERKAYSKRLGLED